MLTVLVLTKSWRRFPQISFGNHSVILPPTEACKFASPTESVSGFAIFHFHGLVLLSQHRLLIQVDVLWLLYLYEAVARRGVFLDLELGPRCYMLGLTVGKLLQIFCDIGSLNNMVPIFGYFKLSCLFSLFILLLDHWRLIRHVKGCLLV